MPRGMSYNLWPNIRWGGARWSDYTGDPQTVNKDQTMLSAAWFEQDVFITLPVEIAARELLDKPQTNHKQLPFLFSRRMRQIDFLPLCVFIAISFAFCSSTSASRCVSPAIMVTEGDGGYPECIMRLCIYTGILFTYGEPLIFRKYP